MKRSTAGQGLVEYALILVLIAVVIIVILTLLGTQVNMVFARILLQLEHPGNYSGDPVTVSNISANADTDCLMGTCNITSSANVSLSGATGSPEVCVRFSDSNGGGGVTCGSPPELTYKGGASGTVSACVIAVEDHSLSGGPYCASASY